MAIKNLFKHMFVDPVDSLKLTVLCGFSWNLASANMYIQDRAILEMAPVFQNYRQNHDVRNFSDTRRGSDTVAGARFKKMV